MRTVTVTQPPNNPPVANFTVSCNQNICGFDGRSSTDENLDALTYTWTTSAGTALDQRFVRQPHLHQRQDLHGDVDGARRVQR